MINESIEVLKKFNLFKNYNSFQFAYIKKCGAQLLIPAEKVILKLGAQHKNTFLLLEGVLKLTATDGQTGFICAESNSAKHPIAQLRPSRYQVETKTPVKVIVLTPEVIKHSTTIHQESQALPVEPTDAIKQKNIPQKTDDVYDKILFDVLYLLNNEKLNLPSLPDIANKIRKALSSENSETEDIIKIINLDQSIVAKMLKMANSAIYNPSGNKINSSKNAFLRLGRKKLANLVLSFAMKELYRSSSKSITNKMNEIWKHSVRVAAISSILARLCTRLDPEEALLAGLLHNIGAVVLINNLQDYQELVEDEESLDSILFDLQAEVGAALLHHWEFPEGLANTVKYSTDWFHKQGENDNFSVIVNLAQWHAFIGTRNQKNLPKLEEISAFRKKSGDKLTPEISVNILKKSHMEINSIISLFN